MTVIRTTRQLERLESFTPHSIHPLVEVSLLRLSFVSLSLLIRKQETYSDHPEERFDLVVFIGCLVDSVTHPHDNA